MPAMRRSTACTYVSQSAKLRPTGAKMTIVEIAMNAHMATARTSAIHPSRSAAAAIRWARVGPMSVTSMSAARDGPSVAGSLQVVRPVDADRHHHDPHADERQPRGPDPAPMHRRQPAQGDHERYGI